MRQFFAIALTFLSLLSTQGNVVWAGCEPTAAHEKCACCVTRPVCDCDASPHEGSTPSVPISSDTRHELPACPCTPLAQVDLVRLYPPLLQHRLPVTPNAGPTGRRVPKFILHCAALC